MMNFCGKIHFHALGANTSIAHTADLFLISDFDIFPRRESFVSQNTHLMVAHRV